MTTYVFPGQGSQMRGMGGELFYDFPELVERADNILGYSITTLCLNDPDKQLNQTNYTQPALYVVNTLYYMHTIKKTGRPSYVAGHSLGEYNALLAADVFDFETGLKLVQKRGELMSKAAGGGMAAILGLKSSEVQTLLEQNELTNTHIANYNSYTQVIISGPNHEVNESQSIFEKARANLFFPLPVSGAFHSPFMKEAQQEFESFLQNFNFNTPSIPIIANVNAQPYQSNNIQSLLIEQITKPVQWTQTIEYLLTKREINFIEVGPKKVLTGLINNIRQGL